MDIAELKHLITSQLSGKTFSISGDDFPDGNLQVVSLIDHFFEGALTLTDAEPSETPDSITIEGDYHEVLFHVERPKLRAVFSIDPPGGDGTVVLAINSVSLPHDWTLSHSFPALGTATISDIDCSNPVFLFDSLWIPASPSEDKVYGMGLQFTVDAASCGPIPELLMMMTEITVDGQLIFEDDVPILLLDSTASPHEIILGTLALSMSMGIHTDKVEPEIDGKDQPIAIGFFSFSAQAAVDDTVLPITTQVFYAEQESLLIQGQFSADSDHAISLSSIQTLLDNAPIINIVSPLLGLLPDQFSDNLYFDGLSLLVNVNPPSPTPMSLMGVSVSTTLKGDWTPSLLGGLFTFSDLRTSFSMLQGGAENTPLHTTNDNVSTTFSIGGAVTLNNALGQPCTSQDASFDVSVSFPDASFQCELMDGQLDISGFIEALSPIPLGIPDIACTELLIAGQLATEANGLPGSQFCIKGTLASGSEQEWVIYEYDAERKLVLTKIELGMTYEFSGVQADASGTFSGGVRGEIQLPGIPDYPIYLMTTYTSEPDATWTFSGGTIPNDTEDPYNLPLGQFINSVLSLVGISSPITLPDAVTLNLLNMSYASKDSEFILNAAMSGDGLTLPGDGITLDQIFGSVIFSTKIEDGTRKYQGEIYGELAFGDHTFNVEYELKAEGDQTLSGSWEATGDNSLGIADMMAVFGVDVNIPEALDLGLTKVEMAYTFHPDDPNNSELRLAASSKNYGDASFIKPAGQRGFMFQLSLGDFTCSLADIPMLGNFVEGSEMTNLKLTDFELVVSTMRDDTNDPSDSPRGISLAFTLETGDPDDNIDFVLPIYLLDESDDTQVSFTSVFDVEDDFEPSNSPMWVAIERNFGPFEFNRIGLQPDGDKVRISLDAGILTSSLGFQLFNLSIGFPINKTPRFDELDFDLRGLGIYMKTSSVEISGSLIKDADLPTGVLTQYSGSALVKAAGFNLSVLAQYASTEGGPSMFMYGILDKQLGGPPCFVITGISLGVGYNRSLRIPTIDEVATFPFVEAVLPGEGPEKGKSLSEILNDLSNEGWVLPSIGDSWLAAGVRFTSFQLIQSFALVVVRFGTTFELALIGMSNLAIPFNTKKAAKDPLAYAELVILASFSPDKGILSVEGRLTPNSYIFSKDCILTGGFAFCTWFKGEFSGDFVTTLGGYSPYVKVPAHYPDVPRIGFAWEMPSITLKGGLYFAITPCCLMAGGMLEAVFESGPLKAWFNAAADMIIAWDPTYYFISIRVSMGVSYNLRINFLFIKVNETITLQLGVDLQLEGPPFHGKARIDLSILSFSIYFGDRSGSGSSFISFPDFVEGFLTPDESVEPILMQPEDQTLYPDNGCCDIHVVNGLLSDFRATPTPDLRDTDWILSPASPAFMIETLLPAIDGRFTFLDQDPDILTPEDGGWDPTFDIGLVGVDSDELAKDRLSITIREIAIQGTQVIQEAFDVVPVIKPGPKALWKKRAKGDAPPTFDEQTLIPDLLFGFSLTPKERPYPHIGPISIIILMSKELLPPFAVVIWSDAIIPEPGDFDQNDAISILLNSIESPSVSETRAEILTSLQGNGLPVYSESELSFSALEASQGHSLITKPYLSYLGAPNPSTRRTA